MVFLAHFMSLPSFSWCTKRWYNQKSRFIVAFGLPLSALVNFYKLYIYTYPTDYSSCLGFGNFTDDSDHLMKNEYFKVWTTPFTTSCLISHDYIFMLVLIGLWISGIVFFFKSISAHITVIEKYQTTPEDYFRAILILDFPDQGKISELLMGILTSKLKLYEINEAYLSDPDSVQIKTVHGDTLLHLAAKTDDVVLAKALLRFENIQVNLTNKNGQNSLYYAQKNQSEDMISLLISNGAKNRTPSNTYIKSNSFSRPVSLLGPKKYDVRKHSNKQRRAEEKTVHFDSTTTPSVTSIQSVSYDHSTNQNSSLTDSSREHIWHRNVLDLNKNRSFEPENVIISDHQEQTGPNRLKSDSPEYCMPPPIEQVNSVLVQNQLKPIETKMMKVKKNNYNPDIIPDFQIPLPLNQSMHQSDRSKGFLNPASKNLVPESQSTRTKRFSSKSYKPAVKSIVSHNSVRSFMSDMSYDSDMFESSNQLKRQPSSIAGGSPQKSILKPKKKLEELWLENNIDPDDVLASEEEESHLVV